MKRLLMIVIAALLLIPSAAFAEKADLSGEWIQIETIVDGTAFVMSGREIVLEVNEDGTASLSGLTYTQAEDGDSAELYNCICKQIRSGDAGRAAGYTGGPAQSSDTGANDGYRLCRMPG